MNAAADIPERPGIKGALPELVSRALDRSPVAYFTTGASFLLNITVTSSPLSAEIVI